MLPTSQRQENLSRTYVRAIAAQAGVLCGSTEQGFGFDLFLRLVDWQDQQHVIGGAQLDVQLKSTTRAEVRAATIVFDLDVRAYNLLRQKTLGPPSLLVVLVLPEYETQWLNQSPEELVLRRCAYWMSLQGADSTTNQTTIRISIPRENVFSVEALQRLLSQSKRETKT